MMEMQGTITCSAGLFDERQFGCLRFNTKGNPEITMGSRVLEGRIEKLKQPMAVLRKTDSWSTFRNCPDLISREIDIVGVINKRLIFSTRPRIISEVAG